MSYYLGQYRTIRPGNAALRGPFPITYTLHLSPAQTPYLSCWQVKTVFLNLAVNPWVAQIAPLHPSLARPSPTQ